MGQKFGPLLREVAHLFSATSWGDLSRWRWWQLYGAIRPASALCASHLLRLKCPRWLPPLHIWNMFQGGGILLSFSVASPHSSWDFLTAWQPQGDWFSYMTAGFSGSDHLMIPSGSNNAFNNLGLEGPEHRSSSVLLVNQVTKAAQI